MGHAWGEERKKKKTRKKKKEAVIKRVKVKDRKRGKKGWFGDDPFNACVFVNGFPKTF